MLLIQHNALFMNNRGIRVVNDALLKSSMLLKETKLHTKTKHI